MLWKDLLSSTNASDRYDYLPAMGPLQEITLKLLLKQ